MDYDLELDRIVSEVEKLGKDNFNSRRVEDLKIAQRDFHKVKVCLQFPDGLKAEATKAVKELEQRTNGKASFFIWSGSNFGGCDYPWYLKDLGFDLLVNFGHSVFKKWADKL